MPLPDVLKVVNNSRVLNWWAERTDLERFASITKEHLAKGYELDPETGILIKKVSPLVVDRCYTLPSDIEKMMHGSRGISVLEGSGVLFINTKEFDDLAGSFNALVPGEERTFDPYKKHGWCPTREAGYLTLKLEYKSSPVETSRARRFNDFVPWANGWPFHKPGIRT
ncbi:MAG: hypothetical protein JSW08_04000 [archaeon]|nr:MAG: hypothetical protein JSW08_04000 [archaeon]